MDTGLLPLTFYERCTLRYAAVQEPVNDEKHAHETKTMIFYLITKFLCACTDTSERASQTHTQKKKT